MRKCAVLVSLYLVYALPVFAQQNNKWPNTLLWKIERDDLKKPSFLFGTMHLTDKRIFNLTDSFYYHFEKAEGFAIEVDFNEFIDSVLQKAFNEAEEESMSRARIGKEDVEADEDITTAVIDTARASDDSIQKPPPPQELYTQAEISKPSKKALRKLRNERMKRLLIHGEMPTILDAYLYGMAMKQGKWLGAVEDVKDQLNLRDEIGQDMDEEDFKQSSDEMIYQMEEMIKTYLAQDLNKIENYVNTYGTERAKSIMFHNRNLKMTQSIDSLSHQRSMFYAVGTAHLPGDSGVIKLLRDRGYKVTPVHSSNKLAAEKYAAKLPTLGWHQVGNSDSLYSIEMPGVPRDYNLMGDLVKMKVHVDITTMTFYMTGHTIAQFSDDQLGNAIKGVANAIKPGSKPGQVKRVDRNGFKGVETIVTGIGVYFRVQLLKKENILFILMSGGETNSKLISADANRFFNSIKAEKIPTTASSEWKEFFIPEKAFSVMMPGKPKRNSMMEKQAEGTEWIFSVHDYTDLSTGLYYVMQVRDVTSGMIIASDSTYFTSFRDNMVAKGFQPTSEEIEKFEGFGAMRFDGVTNSAGQIFFKTKNIVRGNRVYTLMVLGEASKRYSSVSEDFFDSFKFLPYESAGNKIQHADDGSFYSKAPAPFVRTVSESEDSLRTLHASYNAKDAVTYEVIKDQFPVYYWVNNDSSFYEDQAKSMMRTWNDSLLYSKRIFNGKNEGIEQVVQMSTAGNVKKFRMFLHGDTLYTLLAYIPPAYLDHPDHVDFFTSFRIHGDKKIPTGLFTRKTDKLLKALVESDSTGFEAALNAISSADFVKADLPLLKEALIKTYRDDSILYHSVKSYIIRSFHGLADSGTVDFIRQNYDRLKNRGSDQVAMLNVLADYRTQYSYDLLKELIVNKTPVNIGERKSIGYYVTDSLLLAKSLYPGILKLVGNEHFSEDIIGYTMQLLDSNLLEAATLKPYAKDLYHIADTLLTGTALTLPDVWTGKYIDYVRILEYLNDEQSTTLLNRFLQHRDILIKNTAAISLIKNGKPADPRQLELIAADRAFRSSFFDELKVIGKDELFPAKYRTQKLLGESQVYGYSTEEEYLPENIEYIESRDAIFNGEKKRFYLFRVTYKNDEDGTRTSYLGMAGPFDLDQKNMVSTHDAVDIYYDSEFNKKTIDSEFREMLRRNEEYLMNRENID